MLAFLISFLTLPPSYKMDDAWKQSPGTTCELLEYRSAVARNREVFLLNQTLAVTTFNTMDKNFDLLHGVIAGGRNERGKTYVSFGPLLALMQRQARSAFDALSSYQAYQAWVLFRVAIEIPLIMGKWIDDRANVEIWKRRQEDPQPYRREYSGKRLRSRSLPHAASIQTVLSRVNDQFVHANPDYCLRHSSWRALGTNEIGFQLDYFDLPAVHEPHMLALLHVLVFMQESILRLLTSLITDVSVTTMGIESFRDVYSDRVDALVAKDAENRVILTDLGLWPFEAT